MAAGYSSTVTRAPTPGPKSIAGRAIAGHPAWQTPVNQSSIAGRAIAGHPAWNPQGFSQPAAIKAAAAPPAPAAPAVTPHPAAPPAPPVDPRDATYFQNVAQNQFSANQKINQLNLTGAQDQTALTQALAALSYQQPRDQLHLMQRANAQGGLYSSQEGMNQGDLVHQYTTKRTASQQNFQNQMDQIKAQLQGIRGGIPLYNQSQYLAAVQRAIAADQKDPGLGQTPVPPPAPPPSAAPTVSAAHPAASSTGRSLVAKAMAQNAAAKLKQAQAMQAQKGKSKGKGYSSTMKRVK